jgi:glycosyltransferase involved in cell wall biosynthesis
VSLVICTRDRPQALARCLASLPRQTRQPDEIVVVDNASLTGETQQVCRKAGVRYVREDRPGLDIARNTGAQASKSEIVAYTDDDVVLHPWWLERMTGAFDAAHIWAVTGLVLPAELATQAQWHFERYWGFGRGFQRKDFGPDFLEANGRHGCPTWLIGAGASMAFRRSAFARAGFFDERLDVGAAGCSGDSEFWHRLLCAGGTCRYEPSVVAFHYHRRDWRGLSKQIRAYMRGHSAALLVQYERSGRQGNLRRLFVSFPQLYARRLLKRALSKSDGADLLMGEEIAGLLSGIWFYARAKRPGVSPS